MSNLAVNPFSVTKASDFSIEQIDTLWVDLADRRGMTELAKPTSPMPMLILGGKGSGKTHLMRYFSYEAQCIRHAASPLVGIKKDGYLGIYLKCESLDASRFGSNSRFSSELSQLFGYHLELSLVYLLLRTVQRLLITEDTPTRTQASMARDFKALFDREPSLRGRSFEQMADCIDSIRREVDLAVNNCAMTKALNVPISFTRGRLLFGIPEFLVKHLPSFSGVQFQYLIDELELLNIDQQRHINTFLRERRPNCSFKVGSRLYGIKTYETFNDNETNKEGSEFETLKLDHIFRRSPQYRKFCRSLTARRIKTADVDKAISVNESQLLDRLPAYFDKEESPDQGNIQAPAIQASLPKGERPYFRSLQSKLVAGLKLGRCSGLGKASDIEEVIELLRRPEQPLLEKANILAFFKEWADGHNLLRAARTVSSQCQDYLSNRGKSGYYKELLGHFKGDLLAQLRRDCDLPQQYRGIEDFITMSSGLPRNLLNILKHVYKWSIFQGESPFVNESVIGSEAQSKGVHDAAEWFFSDAMARGPEGAAVQQCINRLATLFRGIRFSDKPSECSICTFSACLDSVSKEAKTNIELAENYSLLVKISKGQRDRNSGRIDSKYQINPMLSPLWDLPISRRGAIALSPAEIDAIFGEGGSKAFTSLLNTRLARMTAPTFGKKTKTSSAQEPDLFAK
jgi:hypothetical protein